MPLEMCMVEIEPEVGLVEMGSEIGMQMGGAQIGKSVTWWMVRETGLPVSRVAAGTGENAERVQTGGMGRAGRKTEVLEMRVAGTGLPVMEGAEIEEQMGWIVMRMGVAENEHSVEATVIAEWAAMAEIEDWMGGAVLRGVETGELQMGHERAVTANAAMRLVVARWMSVETKFVLAVP